MIGHGKLKKVEQKNKQNVILNEDKRHRVSLSVPYAIFIFYFTFFWLSSKCFNPYKKNTYRAPTFLHIREP